MRYQRLDEARMRELQRGRPETLGCDEWNWRNFVWRRRARE
jgi:hypothetical protein